VIEGNFAYIGHMDNPHGTSVMDVSDPSNPKIVASFDIPSGLHSHKVRVANDIMVVNRERARGEKPENDFVGLRIFDVSNPRAPKDIGRYVYTSAEFDGYVGTIVVILVVRQRSAGDRHRQPAGDKAGGMVAARRAPWSKPGVQQRRLRGWKRTDLPDRPQPRAVDPGENLVISPEFSVPGIRHRLRLGEVAARQCFLRGPRLLDLAGACNAEHTRVGAACGEAEQ
jgi:hypothetical protein